MQRAPHPAGGRRLTAILAWIVASTLVVGIVGVAGTAPASASPGTLSGPIPGKYWRSIQPKLGVGGTVIAYATALRNFDTTAPTTPLLMGVYLRDKSASGSANVPVVKPYSDRLPNGDSFPLAVSADAATRYILYRSDASNIVTGDTNGKSDVFLFDRTAGTTERVSLGAGGAQGDGDATRGAVTPNGRYVVFVSTSSNLVGGDTNGVADVFVRDRQTGTTTLVSRASGAAGAVADGESVDVAISADGRYVAFSSLGANLVAADNNFTLDVFVRDRTANTTELASLGYLGQGTGASSSPQISADGRYVAFDSNADDLVPKDDNFTYDVFVRDRLRGSTERVSVGPKGEQGDGDSTVPSMSSDGRFIAFQTDAEEFSPNDGNISIDVYVRDMLTHNTVRASEKPNDLDAFADAEDLSLSPDGRYVGFDIDSDEYNEALDVNWDYDIYVKDLAGFFTSPGATGSRYQPVAPKVVLDTTGSATKLTSTTPIDVAVTGGTTGVPTNATAVVVNLVSSNETTAGASLVAYPTGQTKPKHASLWPQVGAAVSNQVVVKVGTGGKVSLATTAGVTDVVAELAGYYAPDARDAYVATPSPMLLDTRYDSVPEGWPAGQPLRAASSYARLDLQVAGVGDVPADAKEVALYLTAVTPSVAGAKLNAFPAGGAPSATAAVLPQKNLAVANLVVVPVGTDGKVSLSVDKGTVQVMAAIAGYFAPYGDELFFPLDPARAVDSTSTSSTLNIPGITGPFRMFGFAQMPIAGRASVPANARDVALALSSRNSAGGGFVITFGAGNDPYTVSHLTPRPNVSVANTLLSPLGEDGEMSVFVITFTSTDFYADAYGYYR